MFSIEIFHPVSIKVVDFLTAALSVQKSQTRHCHLLNLDLANHPETAANPDVAFRISGAFWKLKGLNQLADQGEFETITRRINGGLTGQAERLKYYNKAKQICGT